MATLALAAAGAAIGGYIAPGVVAFGMTGASIGWTIGAVAGNMLFAPRTRQTGPRLSDLSTTSSAYGVSLPTVMGTARIASNIIWAAPLREQENTERVGKGGGGSYVTQYTYFGTWAAAICDGPIASITRIWANGTLIYDIRAEAEPSMVAASAEIAELMTVYLGDESQLPSSVIESFDGSGAVPAYRGVAYVVINDLPLAEYGNAIPNLEFEVIADGSNEVPVLVREYASMDSAVQPPTGARLSGGSILVSRADDDVGGQLVNRSVISANSDSETVEAYSLPAVYPLAYTVVEPTPSQVRNDPNIRVFDLVLKDQYGEDIPGSDRVWFSYLDGYGAISGHLTSLWVENPGSWVSLEWDDTKYLFQAPRRLNDVNTTVLLARLAMPRTAAEAEVEQVVYCYLPDGMAQTTDIGDGNITTPHIAVDEDLKRIVIGYIVNVNESRCVVIDAVTMGIVAIYSGVGSVVGASYGRCISWGTLGEDNYLYVYDISQDGGTVASPLTPTLMNSGGTSIGVVPYEKIPAPAPGLILLGAQLWRYSDSITPAPPSLEDVVVRICTNAGYEEAEVDASSLAGITVQGYVRNSRASGAAILLPLTQAYGFDVTESDGKLLAMLRSSTVDASIAWEDLAIGPNNRAISSSRAQETELPRQLDVSYFSYPADYAIGSQSAQRIVTESAQKSGVDLPIVLSDDDAAMHVRRMMYEVWSGRTTRSFMLGPKWSRLVPSDVVSIPLDADGIGFATARIVSVKRDGISIDCEAVDVDAAAFTQPSVSGTIPGASTATSARPATELVVLPQLPPLRDEDDSYGLYVAASSIDSAWPGAMLYLEPGGHNDPSPIGSTSSFSVIGRTLEALPDFEPHDARLDTASTVQVGIETGTLPSSVTIDDLIEGTANTFCVGDEIIRAMTVTSVSGNVVALSNLLRGIQGTPSTGHISGERVVLLDSSITPVRFESAWVGNDGTVRGVTFGQRSNLGAVSRFIFATDRIDPLPVANLRAVKLENNDIVLDWERRARTRNSWADGADLWLDESTEAYELDIYDSDGESVVRTVSGLSDSTYTYAAADILADQGSAKPTQLVIDAYQIGQAGRGRTETRTVQVLRPTGKLALLLHHEGSNGGTTFTDSSPYAHVITRVGSAAISTSTTQKKFGSTSAYFANVGQNGQYLTIADDPSLNLSTNDFTIDFWVYRTANAYVQGVIHKCNRANPTGTTSNWQFFADHQSNGVPRFIYTYDSTANHKIFGGTLTLNSWNHVAMTRSGSTWRGFINGTNVLEFTDSGVDLSNAYPVYMGSSEDGAGENITQYIDELRILNGYCAWTSNFTPPLQAY